MVQQSIEERSVLERKLLDAVRRIPAKPQAPFQLFVSDRLPALAKRAQESGHAFQAEHLQRQLTDDFASLSIDSLQDLKHRVESDFRKTMIEVRGFIEQVQFGTVIF